LKGLNRLIAYRGLDALRLGKRLGLEALKAVAGVNGNARFGAGHVAFALGPRINAAGRMEDATEVVTLLTTKDRDSAHKIAARLDKLNERRRAVENGVHGGCLQQLADRPELKSGPALALYHKDFHAGVIGIAAQRLVDQFHRPAAVMAP